MIILLKYLALLLMLISYLDLYIREEIIMYIYKKEVISYVTQCT